MKSEGFERFAGLMAILAGVSGLLYSVAFIIIARSAPALGGALSALFLLLGGVFTTAAVIGLYGRLRSVEPGFAAWALALGLAGALGSAIHGGYDLANTLNPPDSAALSALPNAINPRGLLTFGVAGLAALVNGWLISRSGSLPRGLAYVGYVLGFLLIVIYLGRLIVLQAASPLILVPALLAGFIVNPLWYLWLGVALRRPEPGAAPTVARAAMR